MIYRVKVVGNFTGNRYLCGKQSNKVNMDSFDVIVWIYGMLIIACGAFCRQYPDCIAGYNTMKPERKKYVDIDGLSKFTCNCLGVIGVLTVLAFYLLRLLGMDDVKNFVVSGVLLVMLGSFYLMAKAQKFDHYHDKH